MSDWAFINQHRCRIVSAFVPERYLSDDSDGFNGMFRLPHNGNTVRCVASDGGGWRHVSVSIEGDKRTPRWEVMCWVKDLFWEAEDVVMQLHPRKSEYVNMAKNCLHLWQPLAPTAPIPEPPSIFVGLK